MTWQDIGRWVPRADRGRAKRTFGAKILRSVLPSLRRFYAATLHGRRSVSVGLALLLIGLGAMGGDGFPAYAAVGPTAAPPAAIERGSTTGRRVAFAVNVVWGTEYVLPIARTFRSVGGHATFFLGGEWAEHHPVEARELHAMGMEIASHGDRHRHVGSLDLEENLVEIDRANEAIEKATGVKPRLYAPAYGELSPDVLQAAFLRHMPVVMWTIDTIDWRTWHTPDIIQERVMKRLSPGAIVLTHPTDRTLAALPKLLKDIRSQGYQVVTISDLLGPSARQDPGAEQASQTKERADGARGA